jgi:hypothetical protein
LVLWLNQVTQRFLGEPLQTPRADSSCEPLPYTGSDRRLRLAFLTTMRPALDPAGHRVPRVRPTCLSTPRRPRRHRPFAPTLHLHQRKSSRNLHLQYSAKSQSTPRCQSLITIRSDHPPVLGRSDPKQATPPSIHRQQCLKPRRVSENDASKKDVTPIAPPPLKVFTLRSPCCNTKHPAMAPSAGGRRPRTSLPSPPTRVPAKTFSRHALPAAYRQTCDKKRSPPPPTTPAG